MRKNILKIILPSLLAILLFILTIFIIIIPRFEENIMNGKREMIKELTNSAWSILAKYENDEREGLLSREEAQATAISRIQYLRYGQENKDYFWITDMQPHMVMHPFRTDLNGKDLSNFIDPHGKKLFVEFVKTVQQSKHGYVDYMWQWKDDSAHIVPKVSYVKGFEAWGWIVGTGIYIEDVQKEISALTKRLIWISIGITILIALLLLFVFKQSLNIEQKRIQAEAQLQASREKYKTLVEATTEGLLMMINGRISFANAVIGRMLDYDIHELIQMPFKQLLSSNNNENVIHILSKDTIQEGKFEIRLVKKGSDELDVLLTTSTTLLYEQSVNILIFRDISLENENKINLEEITRQANNLLIAELSAQKLLWEHGVSSCTEPIVYADMQVSIQQILDLMDKKQSDAVVLRKDKTEYIGIITQQDIQQRILKLGLKLDNPAYLIMSSPLRFIHEYASIQSALQMCNENKQNHLLITNTSQEIIGIFHTKQAYKLFYQSIEYIHKEIEQAQNLEQLFTVNLKLRQLVAAYIESGVDVKYISSITAQVADDITKRIIELRLEELGEAPVPFCFICVGSEGRKEETLFTDQDNAMIYEDADNDKESVQAYFNQLSEAICNDLHSVGYTYCKGNVMAKNPHWCQPLSTWNKYFSQWILNPESQNILEAGIFFDFRAVYGEQSLADELRTNVFTAIQSKGLFLYQMASSIFNIKCVQLSSGMDTLDIKQALNPLVMMVRLYSLQNNIQETNTIERLRALKSKKIISESTADEMLFIYKLLLRLRYKAQLHLMSLKLPLSNELQLKRIMEIELGQLKKSLSAVAEYQNKVKMDFRLQS